MTSINSPDENPEWGNIRAIDRAIFFSEYIQALENEIERVKALYKDEMALAHKNGEETADYKIVVRYATGKITKPDLTMFEAEFPEKYKEFVDIKTKEFVKNIRITKDDLDLIFPVTDENGEPMEKSRTKAYYEARDRRDEKIASILVESDISPICTLYHKGAKE